jgi:hypothetical protein
MSDDVLETLSELEEDSGGSDSHNVPQVAENLIKRLLEGRYSPPKYLKPGQQLAGDGITSLRGENGRVRIKNRDDLIVRYHPNTPTDEVLPAYNLEEVDDVGSLAEELEARDRDYQNQSNPDPEIPKRQSKKF